MLYNIIVILYNYIIIIIIYRTDLQKITTKTIILNTRIHFKFIF